jgi:hypothetical protein
MLAATRCGALPLLTGTEDLCFAWLRHPAHHISIRHSSLFATSPPTEQALAYSLRGKSLDCLAQWVRRASQS